MSEYLYVLQKMALPRPSRKSKDVALAGLHNLTRRRPGPSGQQDDVEPADANAQHPAG